MDDWRLSNGGKYLEGLSWSWKPYKSYRENWDHDHCEMCMMKFTITSDYEKDDLTEGYSSSDNYRWLCEKCFNDFKETYKWEIKP